MKKLKIALILVLISSFNAYAGDDIDFSAGLTKIRMAGDDKIVELNEGAKITTGDTKITAQNITITGKDYSLINCSGNAKISQEKKGVTILASSFIFNRDTDTVIVDGWAEVQDTKNEIAASAAWAEFDINNGKLRLQMQAKILKNTKSGTMICRADEISFDRDNNNLALAGYPSVVWKDDNYQAEKIKVNLDTEEITLIGEIKGNINGKSE